MKGFKMASLALMLAALVLPGDVQAQITWNWSFGSNAGTFTTDGTAIGGVAAVGSYTLSDFSVTSSGQGAAIGSLSGGQYTVGNFQSTTLPYDMNWDGTKVTLWNSAGNNTFDWWVFNDAVTQGFGVMAFGYGHNNTNDPNQAMYYTNPDDFGSIVTVEVAEAETVTPEPATIGLVAMGLGGIGAVRRRRKAAR